ncbi:MAG: hypothetical protein ACRD0U_18865 [Acidimicrobiales bacterium]
MARFVPYLRARFADDCHLWATALIDEVVASAIAVLGSRVSWVFAGFVMACSALSSAPS